MTIASQTDPMNQLESNRESAMPTSPETDPPQTPAATSNDYTRLERLRMNGIRALKSMIATLWDIIGDWLFYQDIVRKQTISNGHEGSLLAVCFLSTAMAGLFFYSLYYNIKKLEINTEERRLLKEHHKFDDFIKNALVLEIILGDIPQCIMTYIIQHAMGEITPTAVFNVTTSLVNCAFNCLDYIETEASEENPTVATTSGNQAQTGNTMTGTIPKDNTALNTTSMTFDSMGDADE
jgi:hypothetical protein